MKVSSTLSQRDYDYISTSLLLFCELSHAMHYITGDLDMLVENITLKLFAVNDVVYEQNEQVEK